ncbi:MAG: hypothetical protein OXQ29_08125 [Rhodospirillaceae bacterium]|nr:hypothetical protein [Rhodospirillaceae bacterium]
MALRKAGGNWVDGDRFFDREVELEALAERVRDGTHTLLTAQRRMGKTSLVRELLRRLGEEGDFDTVFVDLEGAADAADAIAEIGAQSRPVQGAWQRIGEVFANALSEVADRVETLAVSELQVKMRASVDLGAWAPKGDGVFAALAQNSRPVVLAFDELPILVNRLLKGPDGRVTPERKGAADEFLSWLRKNGQAHRGRIVLILSGSVSLEPILRQAGLSAQANIYPAFELRPWDEGVAVACLGELAAGYGLELPGGVRREMCRRLRCQIPHHVQQFFDRLHEHLRRAGRTVASVEDVDRVYADEMLSVRGQVDLEHYQTRIREVLGPQGYGVALEVLTEAAVGGGLLRAEAIDGYREWFKTAIPGASDSGAAESVTVDDVLDLLQHDGYLERSGADYRFVSALLEDWWRVRHGQNFRPIEHRGP